MAVAESVAFRAPDFYLSTNVTSNWVTLSEFAQYLSDQLQVSSGPEIPVAGKYLSTNLFSRPGQDFVSLSFSQINEIFSEIGQLIESGEMTSRQPVPQETLFVLRSLQRSITTETPDEAISTLRTKAQNLLETMTTIEESAEKLKQETGDGEEISYRRRKKKSVEQEPEQSQTTSPDGASVSQLTQEQQTARLQPVDSNTPPPDTLDLRSTRDLVQLAKENGASYHQASVQLRLRLLDAFLIEECAISGTTLSLADLKIGNPELYRQIGAEFSGTIESFLRQQTWNNPEYVKLLSSPEGMLQVAADFNKLHQTPGALASFANWSFKVQTDLRQIAVDQKPTAEQVQVDPATKEQENQQATEKAKDTTPVLSTEATENLRSESQRQHDNQDVSPLSALGFEPEEQDRIKQGLMLAATYGISPEEAAGLSHEYWTMLYGTSRPDSTKINSNDLFEVLKHEAWHAGQSVTPLTVQNLPLNTFPLRSRMTLWERAIDHSLQMQAAGQNSHEVTKILEAAVGASKPNSTFTPAEAAQVVKVRDVLTVAIPNSPMTNATGELDPAAAAELAAQKLRESHRRLILQMEQSIATYEQQAADAAAQAQAENSPRIIQFEQEYIPTFAQFSMDVQDDAFDFFFDDSDDVALGAGVGASAVSPGSPGRPPQNWLNKFVDNRFDARKKAQDKAAKAVKDQVGKGIKKNTTKQVGNTAAGALSKIPYVGPALGAIAKFVTDDDFRNGVLAGGIGAVGGIVGQLAGLAPVAAIGVGATGGALIGAVLGGPIGALIGGAVGGIGTAIAGNVAKSLGLGAGAGGGAATSAAASGSSALATPLASAGKVAISIVQSPGFVGLAGVGGVMTIGTFIVNTSILNSYLTTFPVVGEEYSKYVVVSKTATPSKIENNTPTQIQYHVTITPREGYTIDIVDASDSWEGLPKGQKLDVQPATQDMSALKGTSILPKETKVLDYQVTASGEDVLLTNTFELKFDVSQNGGVVDNNQSVRTTASVTIGNPKVGCFEFVNDHITIPDGLAGNPTSINWPEADKNRVLEAYSRRAGTNAMFAKLLCSKGTILLYRASPNVSYGGMNFLHGAAQQKIVLYDKGISSLAATEYTIIHEFGHVIDDWNAGLMTDFNSKRTAVTCYTYTLPDQCNQKEAFAEAITDFVVYTDYRFFALEGGAFNFKARYPVDYAWIQENIFGGKECSPTSCNN